MSVKTCSDCGVGMEVGFVPDRARDGAAQSYWYRGVADPATFLGIPTGGIVRPRTGGLPVTAYRCPECGVLKSYAVERLR